MKTIVIFFGLLMASNGIAGSIEFNIKGFGIGKTLKIKRQLKKYFKSCETTEKIGVKILREERYRYECVPLTFDHSICEDRLVESWWVRELELWQEGQHLSTAYVNPTATDNDYIVQAKKLLNDRYQNCGSETK